jgi:flagellar FliL protein
MADDELNPEAAETGDDLAGTEDSDGEGVEESGGFSGKKIVLFIVLPLFILAGAITALYVTGMLDQFIGGGDKEVAAKAEQGEDKAKSVVFYDVPDMVVNLSNDGRRKTFLKLQVSLELENEADKQAVEKVMPRVIDHFQTYLRELRTEDLSGSAGIYRMRQELLARVRTAVYPVEVKDVLFREVLIQ